MFTPFTEEDAKAVWISNLRYAGFSEEEIEAIAAKG